MRIAAALAALALVASAPLRADWLVLKSGARIETQGPWQVRGRQVRFTTAKTMLLQSLPLDEVDFEASKGASGPDPNRTAAEALAEGGAVVVGVDPDFRGGRAEPKPLPRAVKDVAKETLNQRSIEADRELFGEGTLSSGTSVVGQLYERSAYLRSLRERAVARVGEATVSEMEQEFASFESEIYSGCLELGADPAANEQWYCYAIVLEVALQTLAEAGSLSDPASEQDARDEPLEPSAEPAGEPAAEPPR
jgi:hypothetical protein